MNKKLEMKWIKGSHKKGFPSLGEWKNYVSELKELIEATGELDGIKNGSNWKRYVKN